MNLNTLVRRAASGLSPDSRRMFKPSMVYQVMKDPWGLWCGCHAPEKEAVDETSRYEELRMQWGAEFEARWVRKHHPDAVEIVPKWGKEALELTLKAMLDGARAIHSPQLWALEDGIYGVGDVIVRSDEAPSDLGPYHYRLKEIKRSGKVKDYQVLQAVFYNRILGRLQGCVPRRVEVVLEDGAVPAEAAEYEEKCDEILKEWRGIRDGKIKPEPPAFDEAASPWRPYTNKILERRKDLTLLPGISAASRGKLREKLGVARLDDLEGLEIGDFQKALGPDTGSKIWRKYRANRSGKPVFVPGEKLVIPRRKRRFYFDFETCDAIHPSVPPHVYLVGACDEQGGGYRHFLARGAGEEERIFREFLDYVGDPRDAVLYHWTTFEIGRMGEVMERHPKLKAPLGRLVESCVDLKACIAGSVIFGTRTYSLKEVAPFLGFHWRQGDVDAYASMILYWEWLEDGDASKIDRILKYNEDDCVAMVRVDEALQRP